MIAPNRDDYSQHVEFNHVHHYGLDILSDFGGIYKEFVGSASAFWLCPCIEGKSGHHSRYFNQVGHQTTYSSRGNEHFYTK